MTDLSNEFITWLNKAKGNKKKEVKERLASFCNKYEKEDLFETNKCALMKHVENDFFIALLGEAKLDTTYYRYTSLESFVRNLENGTQSMCSLIAMNDATEKDYCLQYMKEYVKAPKVLSDNIMDNFSRANNKNHYYITSLMDKTNRDELDMWRIYGDDGKGVMLEFEVCQHLIKDSFFFANILYETSKDSNGAIKLVYDLMTHKFSNGEHIKFEYWHVWQHMFKPYEYRNEHEVRLLYSSEDVDQWVLNKDFNIIMPIKLFNIKDNMKSIRKTYPLNLKSILLGPKCPEKKINVEELKSMLYHKGLSNINVDVSSINSYR